jgi:hypothetical protein
MVVRINTGKSITGVIRYNELKRNTGKAELISSQGFLPGVEELTMSQLGKRFGELTALNTRTKTNAVHISLNFAPGDRVDSEQMKNIALSYLERIGFGKQPCLIYRHHDAGHTHLHIVTCNIDSKGKRIETHNLGKNQSEVARKELERIFNLVPAEKQQYTGADLKTIGNMKYGDRPTKAGINAVLNHVLTGYEFSSLGEFNAILKAFGVEAYRGEPNSLRYKNRGLVYHFLDDSGKRLGVPLKASSFYRKPTIQFLEKRYEKGKKAKEKYLPEIRVKLRGFQDKDKSKTLAEWERNLKKQGITLGLNYTKDGQLFGVTYVDHATRIGVKGSDVGKEFGAHAIAARLGLNSAKTSADARLNEHDVSVSKEGSRSQNSGFLEFETKDQSLKVLETMVIGQLSDSAYQGPVFQGKKKKKKKDSKPTTS